MVSRGGGPRGVRERELARVAGRGGLRGRHLVQAGLAIMAPAAAVPGAGGAAVALGRGLDEVLDACRLPLGSGRLRRHAPLPPPAGRPAPACPCWPRSEDRRVGTGG